MPTFSELYWTINHKGEYLMLQECSLLWIEDIIGTAQTFAVRQYCLQTTSTSRLTVSPPTFYRDDASKTLWVYSRSGREFYKFYWWFAVITKHGKAEYSKYARAKVEYTMDAVTTSLRWFAIFDLVSTTGPTTRVISAHNRRFTLGTDVY